MSRVIIIFIVPLAVACGALVFLAVSVLRRGRGVEAGPVPICLAAVRLMKDMLVVFDSDGKLADANASAVSFFEFLPEHTGRMTLADFLGEKMEIEPHANLDGLEICLPDASLQECYFSVADIDFPISPVSSNASAGEKKGRAFIFHDITKIKSVNKDNAFYATHDRLTGLLNRYSFQRELSHLNMTAKLPVTVVVFNINGLQGINDACGVEAGDLSIQRLTHLIKKTFHRKDALLARLSGDELLALLYETPEEDVFPLIEKINDGCTQCEVPFTVTAGLCSITGDSGTIEDAVGMALCAMYGSKR